MSVKTGIGTESLLCQRKVFILYMKYFSSSAVQKEPTQSPVQSHSSGHSALRNRLSVDHHWRPSPGWILRSHCEWLCRVVFLFCFFTICLPLVKEVYKSYWDVFSLSALRPNSAGPYHWDPCLPAWNLPPSNSLLCIQGLPRLLLWRYPRLWWLTNTTALTYTHNIWLVLI